MANQIQKEILKIIKRDENITGSVNVEKLKQKLKPKIKIKKKELQKEIMELFDAGYVYETKPQEWRYLG